jgi:hypothetical protein
MVICLIVFASFAIFAVDQTRGASTRQREALNGGAATSPNPGSRQESAVHKAIDEASDELTSPFSPVTSGSSSAWLIRGVNLLLALAVYGFGLGLLAGVIRVRS